jgi:hypothetical protein
VAWEPACLINPATDSESDGGYTHTLRQTYLIMSIFYSTKTLASECGTGEYSDLQEGQIFTGK